MSTTERIGVLRSPRGVPCEQFDVVIVGAGISGVGAGHHLTHECPGMTFVMLEMQDSFGGTWLTHRYPGVRSDSDLFTFGYRFKPWTGAPLASREEILRYMGEVIEDDGLDAHIRYRHHILSASWSSEDNRWTLQVSRPDGGDLTISAKFLWMCQGYYRHAEGYLPAWEGLETYEGKLVHPQTWPKDIDLKDKNVVVIGSGATAATLIPAIADECRHITMLQRSPGYYRTGRNVNELADMLRALQVDEKWIHEIVRRKVLHDQHLMAKRMFTGVPNFVWVFGYFRASWTMRADLVSDFVCRLLRHMDETRATRVTPALPPEDHGMQLSPWISPDNFNPGYLNRSMHLLPKSGDEAPWQNNQDYWSEKDEFASIDLTETALVYGGPDLAKSDRWAKEKRSNLTESIEDATAKIE